MGSFKLQFSFGFVTSCYVIMNISIAWAIDKLKITQQDVMKPRENFNLKEGYGSGQKCSKELKNHSFTSVETIVVKLQYKKCPKINIFHVLSHKTIATWVSKIPVQ